MMPGTLRFVSIAALLAACVSGSPVTTVSVMPDFETAPVASEGDAADDPAILVGESAVRLLGTNKRAGLLLYDLEGNERAFLASGRVNNVDAALIEGDRFVAAASNRTEKSLDLYIVDVSEDRIELRSRQRLNMADPYGLCMGRTPELSVFVGDKAGRVEQWRVGADYSFERVRLLEFESQTEGCVYDPTDDTLYVGEETRGIWSIELSRGERRLFAETDGQALVADVEGLDIYHGAQHRYLIASSQGDDGYLIYRLESGERLLKFRIGDDPESGLDGAQETDGLAVTSESLPGYAAGILVVQDGKNQPDLQNFKGIDWQKIQIHLLAD